MLGCDNREGLQQAVGLQRGGGWDESIKICTIANVIAVDAFVVGKGVCAGRVSCRAASPTLHPHGLQSVATFLRERSEKWPFKAKINVILNISA